MEQQTTIHSLRDHIKFQFDISRQLLEYHLDTLHDKEYLAPGSSQGLHIHKEGDVWKADWPESEGYETGPASIAWTMWHITYWWEMVLDHSFGSGTLQRSDIDCYGNVEAAKEKMTALADRWENILANLSDEEFLSTEYTKWPFRDLPFHKVAGWLNLELMKNAAEIGSCRFDYASKSK
jgi:DinB superfamily